MSTSRSDERLPYHHGDLRTEMLAAAADLLEERGHAELSMREVARRVGVSHNAPYRHFPDRQALLDAIAAEGFRQLAAEMAMVTGGSPAERLALLGQKYVEAAVQRPGRFALMWTVTPAAGEFPQTGAAAMGLLAVLTGAVSEVTGSDDRVDIVASWSLVHGLAHLVIQGHLGVSATPGADRSQARRLIEAVTRRFATALAGAGDGLV